MSYIGTVSGNRLRRRGRREWVVATLLLLPDSLPSAESQKNKAVCVGLIPSSRPIRLHGGKEKAKLGVAASYKKHR